MKLCLKILAMAVTAVATYSLTSCAAPPSFSYQNVTVSIAAACSDCINFGFVPLYLPNAPQPPNPGSVLLMPVTGGTGGVTIFTATVTNAPQTNITWTLYPTPNLASINNPPTGTSTPITESGNSVGTLTAASGNTLSYASPSSVPVYSGAALQQALALGIPQGDVLLVASVPGPTGNSGPIATASQLIQVFNNPTAYLTPHTNTQPAGLTNPVVTVARNTSFQFYGGVAGTPPCTSTVVCGTAPLYTVDNAPLWEVCPAPFGLTSCVVGGTTALGTITQTGLYTAPAAIPNPQPVILVTSHFSPTITNTNNYANIAIN